MHVYHFPESAVCTMSSSWYLLQIVHWRNHLKFPENSRLSPEAKDLVCGLLCDVQNRLGTKGAKEIKACGVFLFYDYHRGIILLCLLVEDFVLWTEFLGSSLVQRYSMG